VELTERIVGAFLGLACGDALGAPVEFMSQAELRARWGTLKEMVGGGQYQWAPGEWTDDTGMALCVADGVLANPDDPVGKTGERFLAWRRTAKDVGNSIRAALSAYRGDWAAAARSIPQVNQGKAAGKGSLMRTLPVALAYADTESMLRTSARLSAMTHWDPQAEVCCAIYCLWVNAVLEGASLRDGWHQALAAGRSIAERGPLAADTPGPAPLPADFWERLAAMETRSRDQLQPIKGYAGYVVDCLEAAVWCCLTGETLEDVIVRAVNLAGESDTIAAVAGGVAGAAWGCQQIPDRWLAKLHQREWIERTARRLGHFRCLGELTIDDCDLRPEHLPGEDADLGAIVEFGHTFNGYDFWGAERCLEIGRRLLDAADSLESATLTELRTALFFFARAVRHADTSEYSDGSRAIAREFIGRIRKKLSDEERPDGPYDPRPSGRIPTPEEEELRRRQEVYATPGLPGFEYSRIGERLYAGRNPLTARDVARLAAEGITHVLDLRENWEWIPPRFGAVAVEAMRRCGMHRQHQPIRDLAPPMPADLEAACAFLEEALTDPAVHVYVHCRAGQERTAAILVAFHACRHGVSYDDALKALQGGRRTLRPLPEQARAVRTWLRQRRSTVGERE
jgi:ADP-ribosyl-[dinitrogen reductase] hydrolase